VTITSAPDAAANTLISYTASADADVAGYAVYFASTSGFDPLTTGSVVTVAGLSAAIFGLAAGTYYVKVAPFDAWTARPDLLNFSAEDSFVISTGGGGGAPSGGSGGGGGWNNRDVEQL
jgi:hypothetical protein